MEAGRELIELEVDAEAEQERAGAELAGDCLKWAGRVGTAAQGVGELRVGLDGAVDVAAGARRRKWRAGVVFHVGQCRRGAVRLEENDAVGTVLSCAMVLG